MPRWLPKRLHLPSIESFTSPVEGQMALCRWFIRLRWLAVVALFVIVAVTRWVVGIELPLEELLGLGAALAVYNLLFHWYLEVLSARPKERMVGGEARRFAHVQVITDLLCMTVLLHVSGGVENPLSTFYVFHVLIASIMLPKGESYAAAALAFALFAALVLIEYLFPGIHYHLRGYSVEPQFRNWRFIFGHLGVLAVTLTMSAFFTTAVVARLREQQAELAATSRRLAGLEERKSRFLRVAAHQLRSPLSAIHSLLTVVLRSYVGVSEEKRLDMIRRAENRTRQMLELLADLLALSRLRDARDQQRADQLVAPDELVQRVVDLWASQAEEKRQTLAARLEAGHAQIVGDPERIRDVFTNLISNAIKYTPEGGRIEVATRAGESSVVCEVADNGIGIPPEDQEHLFEEFFRASNARELAQEGTGLGLSIVREIVEAQGGTIAAQSQLGQGTRFTVTFPLAVCELPKRATEA